MTNEPFYKNRLYRNDGNNNHFIIIKTVGVLSNRDGIGARLSMIYGGGMQIREVGAGSGFTSMNSLPVEFGLGEFTVVDTLFIRWPSGVRDTMTVIGADRLLTCTEGEGCTFVIIGIQDEETRIAQLPENYILHQNYPNPFNPVTTINYDLPERGFVTVTVFDIRGRKVKELVDRFHDAGSYGVRWDAGNSAGGIYFMRLTAVSESGDIFTQTRKMSLLK